jgi:hypothetical protein
LARGPFAGSSTGLNRPFHDTVANLAGVVGIADTEVDLITPQHAIDPSNLGPALSVPDNTGRQYSLFQALSPTSVLA